MRLIYTHSIYIIAKCNITTRNVQSAKFITVIYIESINMLCFYITIYKCKQASIVTNKQNSISD